MTVVILILGLIVVVGVALAVEVLRMNRWAPAGSSAESLEKQLRSPVSYEPLQRLFKQEDMDRVSERPDLAQRLSTSRRAAMRLYLKALRRDFMGVWTICRLLAPVSQDPNFLGMLGRQLVTFHTLYGLLQLRCLLGFHGNLEIDARRLVDSLAHLKGGATRVLETADPITIGGHV